MEILRKVKTSIDYQIAGSRFFGTLEEISDAYKNKEIALPCVIKASSGSMSKRVWLARNEKDLFKFTKKVNQNRDKAYELKDKLRELKYNGYKKESIYQSKFIVQPFVPDLKYDWKILIYGNQYYALKRHIKKNDFRASGSHVNYQIGKNSGLPLHM